MRQLLLAVFTLLSCQTFGQVQEFTLNNGLKVLVKEDHRSQSAVSMIWYRVGSADEPFDLTGVSHAIEHMMFKGTSRFPAGVFSKTIAAEGGQDNAATSNDYTTYHVKIEASRLAKVFELEADRMQHLLLSKDEFVKEIQVIQEERRLRTDNNPQSLTFERFLATAHLAEPYHHPVIGWMSSLKQMQIEDLRSWYQRYYRPNNATLVVVGDVNADKVHALAKQYFEAIPKGPIYTHKPQVEPPELGKKTVTVHAEAKWPLWMLGFNVPSVSTAKNTWEPYALELMTAILDGGEGSRFAKNLVRGAHVATGAEVYYNLYSRYPTQFMVFGAPSQNHSVEDLKKSMLAELEDLKKHPLTPIALQRVKKQIIAQKTFEKDSLFAQAMELGLLDTLGLGWQQSERYQQEIARVTAAQIQETAQRYFEENNSTEAQLIPNQSTEVKS